MLPARVIMKRAVTLLLMIILVLFSGISIKYSAHFCSGTVVATMFSLKGGTATCGMEDENGSNTVTDLFKTHCCDNVSASLQFKINYIPSSVYTIGNLTLQGHHSFLPYISSIGNSLVYYTTTGNIRPPGSRNFDPCTPESLCILRI